MNCTTLFVIQYTPTPADKLSEIKPIISGTKTNINLCCDFVFASVTKAILDIKYDDKKVVTTERIGITTPGNLNPHMSTRFIPKELSTIFF